MKIISNFESLVLNKGALEKLTAENPDAIEEVCKDVFKELWIRFAAYGSSALDNDKAKKSFVFGAIDPEQVVSIAAGWNIGIRNAFRTALTAFSAGYDMPLPRVMADTLHNALHEVCDAWWDGASHCLYLGDGRFHCLLTDQQLEDIRQRPEQYIVLNLDVTSRAG